MTGREHQRIPYAVQVQFRTASSFLVAYSVNLSRGGLFIETEELLDTGTEVSLQFAVPGTGPILARGRVAWARQLLDQNGPPGIGVEFDDIVNTIGPIIDRLVADFSGVNVLLMSADDRNRKTLSRLIRSIISTAEVVGATDASVAENILDSEIDLVIIDLDGPSDEALSTLVTAHSMGIPTVALGSESAARDRAREAGAVEVASNPPPSAEFQRILVSALGKPATVRRT
ncbi:MAG: TIGR02266 family protein [Deltaproteobacteria bacterium]|jgi:uncharacterized protein (TIGR02266 family)|nr:TIGR02266 family protein [Deltaproteobacteria bacterium]